MGRGRRGLSDGEGGGRSLDVGRGGRRLGGKGLGIVCRGRGRRGRVLILVRIAREDAGGSAGPADGRRRARQEELVVLDVGGAATVGVGVVGSVVAVVEALTPAEAGRIVGSHGILDGRYMAVPPLAICAKRHGDRVFVIEGL